MTIAIALAHENGVTIGSDRFSCAGNYVLLRDNPKWFVSKNGLSVASSGAAEIQQILASESASSLFAEDSAYRFCEKLRAYLCDVERWEPARSESGSTPTWEIWLLITDGERVWEVSNTLYPLLAEPGSPAAIGCGYEFAMGAMYSPALSALPYIRVLWGLRAAIHYDIHCGGEPWIKTIKKAAAGSA